MKRALLIGFVTVFLLGVLAAGLLAREASRAPAGAAPARHVVSEAPTDPSQSRIALTARLPLASLQALVAERVGETVVELQGEPAKGDWRYDLAVVRTGEPSVRGDARGRLQIDMPLAIEAKAYRGRKADRRARRGSSEPEGVRLQAEIALSLLLDYQIGPTWKADPQVDVRYTWTDEPRLKLGPLSFGVRGPVEKKLGPKLDEAASRIRQQLMEQDTLAERIETAWISLHRPRALEGGTGWLQIEPSSLAMATPRVHGDDLAIPIVLQAHVALLAGDPPTPVSPAPLPARLEPSGPEGVRIAAAVQLPWNVLEERARAALWDRTFESELGTLQIRDVHLYPSGQRVALGFELDVVSSGRRLPATVWFLGRPEIEPQTRSVRIEDFDYSVHARAAWLDTVNHALLREALRDGIEPSLVFGYGPQADALLERVRERPADDGLALAIDTLQVVRVGLSEDALVIGAELTGSAELVVAPPR